jgi:hypothetical protein
MVDEKQQSSTETRPVDAESNPSTSPEGGSKPSFKDRLKGIVGTWYYAWEVFGVVASACAIIAIVIVVYRYNGRQAPNWTAPVPGRTEPFRLTLNSLLSILSTFGSICAMIPVTKCLGQLKYLWFMEKDRTLADLETFDSASRGKVGSAQLMWKLRFK